MDPIKTEVVVLGAGPGGYAAAFYAADKGKKVILVERDARLGGVCLNRGCIPSKALLHAAQLITEARESNHRGISFGEPKIDLDKLRKWKDSILEKAGRGHRGSRNNTASPFWPAAVILRTRRRYASKPRRDRSLSSSTRRLSRSVRSRPCRKRSTSAIRAS